MEQVLTILCNNRSKRLAMLSVASGGSCTLLAICDSGGSYSVRLLWVPRVFAFLVSCLFVAALERLQESRASDGRDVRKNISPLPIKLELAFTLFIHVERVWTGKQD